ncbi:hypothetical protein [Nakamurella alba]|uniref:hypothetical protein n=1 Tax=Nakamurella alba TaxID=2665158 RepID=UPI0018AADC87|nr:hypothetical protein [Nakamurella alba]
MSPTSPADGSLTVDTDVLQRLSSDLGALAGRLDGPAITAPSAAAAPPEVTVVAGQIVTAAMNHAAARQGDVQELADGIRTAALWWADQERLLGGSR